MYEGMIFCVIRQEQKKCDFNALNLPEFAMMWHGRLLGCGSKIK